MRPDLNSIHNYKISRKLSPLAQNKLLMQYLEEITVYSTSKKIIKDISSLLSMPEKVIKFEFKYYFFRSFRNSLNIFSLQFNYLKILRSYIKIYFIFIYLLLYSNKKKKVKSYDIIIDDVEFKAEYLRTKEVGKKFKNYLIIGSLKIKDEAYYNFRYKNIDLKLIFETFNFNFFKKVNKYFYLSIKNKINILDIILHLSKLNIKYEYIFRNFKSKYLFQERHTHTSKIKQHLFKKNGGLITSSIQKNIIQLNAPGSFCSVDVLFSLGKKTHEKLQLIGADIKKIYPVGSLYLNLNYFNKPKIQNSNKSHYDYDIINFASRMDYFQDTHENFIDDWYEHFSWLAKLSNDFPSLKIAIKQRNRNNLDKDKRLNKILENSNVKIIIGENELDRSTSYNYCFNSKVLCTWTSTVAFEMIGHKIPCFIMDPNGRNESFFPNDNFNNKFKVKSYAQFKSHVIDTLEGKKIFNFDDSDDYCINSENTINRITSYLEKIK